MDEYYFDDANICGPHMFHYYDILVTLIRWYIQIFSIENVIHGKYDEIYRLYSVNDSNDRDASLDIFI